MRTIAEISHDIAVIEHADRISTEEQGQLYLLRKELQEASNQFVRPKHPDLENAAAIVKDRNQVAQGHNNNYYKDKLAQRLAREKRYLDRLAIDAAEYQQTKKERER